MADREPGSIEVEGYASIRSARVDLGRLNVLIGANGAGKSNFIRVFELLGRLVEEDPGDFVGLNGGASALLNSAGVDEIRVFLEGRPHSYEAVLEPGSNDELIFKNEVLSRSSDVVADDFDHWNISGGNRGETSLHGLDREDDVPIAAHLVDLLRGCRVYHFPDHAVRLLRVPRRVSRHGRSAIR
ncbi:AAA family ATPase [Saccharothrix yanglingensis]|uniref:ATPase AAA-type core domain-containing protein n=1 Tax=Saccharothrix yanglingensis TaxID=659496 RepID=A0ABU0WZ96_9PSEU|nr:AAA family ATPase [Saccharothrix yanglingensis]MDQ2584793.1 hypothetical protein [Saccharothrix yanglingensis]